MELITAIAVAALAWAATILVLVALLFSDKIPYEENNMAFYLFIQAAVPTAVFWFATHH
jgi:hypothetical protein